MSIDEFDDMDDIERTRPEDFVYTAAKTAVGMIPVAGSILAELVSFMFAHPLEKRKSDFIRQMDARLKELEEKGLITIEELKTNEDFMNVVINAIPMALRAFEDEKRTAFRNTIVNTALKVNPDETKTQIFLRRLDEMTVVHIRILQLIKDPKQWFLYNQIAPPQPFYNSSLSSLIMSAYPELKEENTLIDIVWDDLKRFGFHDSGGVKTMMTADGIFSPRTTKIGSQFLDFITYSENE